MTGDIWPDGIMLKPRMAAVDVSYLQILVAFGNLLIDLYHAASGDEIDFYRSLDASFGFINVPIGWSVCFCARLQFEPGSLQSDLHSKETQQEASAYAGSHTIPCRQGGPLP